MNLSEVKPGKELAQVIETIAAEQNDDGGWSQMTELGSDAYATGQTLYVLARAGVKPQATTMKRGVNFLIRTQLEDGSWAMHSRVNAKNLSPITGAGTAWALLGLIRSPL
jgi:squalene cyclase